MNSAVTFDTLAFAKKLEASGIEVKHAEGVSEALRDVFEENLSTNIFTQNDGELLKSELKADMSKLKTEIITWVVGLLLAQTAIIISIMAAMKFVH